VNRRFLIVVLPLVALALMLSGCGATTTLVQKAAEAIVLEAEAVASAQVESAEAVTSAQEDTVVAPAQENVAAAPAPSEPSSPSADTVLNAEDTDADS
jgi:PBP1b-binding outer membrane lipoprotein LpoB